jgi:hypothetical protein
MHTTTNQNTNDIIALVTELPGITAKEIMDFMPHMSSAAVSSCLHSLKNKGTITLSGKKRMSTKVGPRAVPAYKIGDGTPAPRPKKMKLKSPTEAGLNAQLEALKQKVAELEAWKVNAMARCPELSVPPIVLKARELVAAELRAHADHTLADAVAAGKKDDTMLVRVTIKALEEGNE